LDGKRPSDPVEKWRARRASALWTIAVGFGMLFLGGRISTNFLLGGFAMVVGGLVWLGVCAGALRHHREDPWKDPEIDAWERKEWNADKDGGHDVDDDGESTDSNEDLGGEGAEGGDEARAGHEAKPDDEATSGRGASNDSGTRDEPGRRGGNEMP
jgi:hypothetical protein